MPTRNDDEILKQVERDIADAMLAHLRFQDDNIRMTEGGWQRMSIDPKMNASDANGSDALIFAELLPQFGGCVHV